MKTEEILKQRFGKDSLIALATVEDGIPYVRTVDAVYIDNAFYVVTYSLSGKMQQIAKNPTVAISGEWFTQTTIYGRAFSRLFISTHCTTRNSYKKKRW